MEVTRQSMLRVVAYSYEIKSIDVLTVTSKRKSIENENLIDH